jgi:hypothetical protein
MAESVEHALMRQYAIGERDVVTKANEGIGHERFSPMRCGRLRTRSARAAAIEKFFAWILVTILMIDRQVIEAARVEFHRQISVTGLPLYKHS